MIKHLKTVSDIKNHLNSIIEKTLNDHKYERIKLLEMIELEDYRQAKEIIEIMEKIETKNKLYLTLLSYID